VARDRKRAKQRRERGRASAGRSGSAGTLKRTESSEAPGPAGELPAALEHAASNVDEFDIAIARGAGGAVAQPDDAELAERADEAERAGEAEREGGAENAAEDLLQTPAAGDGGGGRDGDRRPRDGGAGRGDGAERPSGAPLREGNRVIGFLRASWAELQRVQWPDRRGVTQATAVVIGFVAVAGAYLGAADFVAKEIVEVILG
jgi:preprotein translocase SecE subunit